MPTNYDSNFIPREMENEEVKNVLDKFSALIEETVNFASHVFRWCLDKINGEEELIPVFMSFRQVFELIDSISILVKYSAIDPCEILLRSVFESTLYAEYIFESDTKNRGLAFMLCFHQDMLKSYRRWDPEDQMYQEFKKVLKRDKILRKWNWPDFPEIQKIFRR